MSSLRHFVFRLASLVLLQVAFATLAFADGYRCTYDSLDRITRVEYHNGLAIDYSFDANGNMTSEVVSGGVLAGDVDGSGTVNVGDALAVLQCAALDCVPDRTWCPACPSYGGAVCAADVDGNTQVSVVDSLSILQCAVGRCTPSKPWCTRCSGGGLAAKEAFASEPEVESPTSDCVRLSVESVTAVPGQEVDILVRIDIPSGLEVAGLQFGLTFDSSHLEIVPADANALDNLIVTNLSAPDSCGSAVFGSWNKAAGPTPFATGGSRLQIGLMSTSPVATLSNGCLLRIKGNATDKVRIKSTAVAGSNPSALSLVDLVAFDSAAMPVPLCAPGNGTLSVVGCSTLSLGGATITAVPLSWTPAIGGGATAYQVQRTTSTGSCTGGTVVRTHTDLGSLSWSDSGLTPNTRYCYRIVPQGGGCLQPSNCDCKTTCSSALALTSTASTPSSVSLSWTRVPGASGYEVLRASGTGCSGAAPIGLLAGEATTTLTDAGLSEGSTWSYVVRPLDMGCDETTSCLTVTTPTTPCVRIASTNASGRPGDDVDLLLKISIPPSLFLGGTQFRIGFDPSRLQILPANPNDLGSLVATNLPAPDSCGSSTFAEMTVMVGPTPYAGQPYLDIALMGSSGVTGVSDGCLLRIRGSGESRVRIPTSAPTGSSLLSVSAVQAFDPASATILSCAPQSGSLAVLSSAPAPVPDGRIVVKDRPFTVHETEGGSIVGEWSTACSSTQHLVEVDLGAPNGAGSWSITGVHCSAATGASFAASSPADTPLVGFLVSSHDGAGAEGTYGYDSNGANRSLALVGSPANSCGFTIHDGSGTCP